MSLPHTNAIDHYLLRRIRNIIPKNFPLNWRKYFNITTVEFVDEYGNDIRLDKTPIIKAVYKPLEKLWMEIVR